jgi:hypothetical protein
MPLPTITFSEDCDNGAVFSVLYIMSEWLRGGPVFRFHLGPNASVVGEYHGDDDDSVMTIRLWSSEHGARTDEFIRLEMSGITEIEYV